MMICAGIARASLLLLVAVIGVYAQAPAPKSLLGTVSAVRASEIEVRPDTGAAIEVKIGAATITQRVAPGQTDLSKAEPIALTDLAAGDRVLVTLAAEGADARRIIVIAATDLAKRDAADRADWQRRGIAGVVTAVNGNEITIESRSLGTATKYTVTADPKSSFKKYANDSVRYADTRTSALSEVGVGDQLRARGQKSPDGLKVDAEDIIFGTFLSKAGSITAISPEAHELTIKDLGNNKKLTVRFTADSQVKRMPDAAAMQSMMTAAGRGGAGSQLGSQPPGGRGGPDIAQMLELLPPIKFEDLKPGEIVVVSAIQGAKPDQITAITFLANAETLVQLAMAARGAGATGPAPSLAGLAGSISNVGP
jgi:hypothetical protein